MKEIEYDSKRLNIIIEKVEKYIEETENFINKTNSSNTHIFELLYNKCSVHEPPAKVHIYPNEIEPAHFKIVIQNQSCRFSIDTGEPMDKLPKNFNHKKMCAIKIWYELEHNHLAKFYNDHLPDNAPPQAKARID